MNSQTIDLGYCNSDSLSIKGFAALKKKFANKRIIIIGEQDHGVGTDYENFAHMVKCLHEEMGFNVVAQEFFFILSLN
jgi:erythromycin esterase